MISTRNAQKILMIDDSPDVHRLVRAKVSRAGYEVLSSYNVPDGLHACRTAHPDLILLDLVMPGVDGFAALKALKDSAATIEIPVIVLSGSSAPSEKVRAFDLGATDFVAKPFDFSELLARIRKALRTSGLMRMLAERSQIDGLTGLGNRAKLDDELEKQIKMRDRARGRLSIIIGDLDHFKGINDTYGHACGDNVLEAFGSILSASIRAQDTACRYGGEEFVLILPGTSAEEAVALAERIRTETSGLTFEDHPELSVTASFGVSDTPEPPNVDTATGWLEAADRALYAAKKAGRDRVCVFDQRHMDIRPTLRAAG